MDNQLQLLNFHKMLANFANNLVGAFMILIVYQYTGSLAAAMIYGIAHHTLRLFINIALDKTKVFSRYPQLMLLIRAIPIISYNILVILLELEFNVWFCIIGICIFQAFDYGLNNVSKEIIFNYSSLNKSGGSLGLTRVFEQIGTIVALIAGGMLLDLSPILVVCISISLYLISVIPLVNYYLKSRKSKTFNKDAISNAVAVLDKKENAATSSKKLSKQLLITYGFVYFSFAFLDLMTGMFNLSVYISQGSFTTAGILSAIFNVVYMVGSYIAGDLNEKKDLSIFISICCAVIGASVFFLPYIAANLNTMFWAVCVIYGIIGILYPFVSIFVLQRMLSKTRIVGCSNSALVIREEACVVAYSAGYAMGFVSIPAIFILMGIALIATSGIIPACEEITRKNLVDYLQNNEVTHSKKRTKKPAPAKAVAIKETKSTASNTKVESVDAKTTTKSTKDQVAKK